MSSRFVAVIVGALVLLGGCAGRPTCCRPCCPPTATLPPAPRPPQAAADPDAPPYSGPGQEKERAIYDGVYAANRALQDCLKRAGGESDGTLASKKHDECVENFRRELQRIHDQYAASAPK